MTAESLTPGSGNRTRFQPRTRLRKFSVEEIVADKRLQTRAGLNQAVVRDYAAAMLKDAKLPPLLVAMIDNIPYTVDGFHRHESAKRAGWTEIQADAFEATWPQALEVALGANRTHGYRRTNADKRRAVTLALNTLGDCWGDKVIADLCGVADRFVAKLRKSGGANSSPPQRIGRDGKLHKVRPVSALAAKLPASGDPAVPPQESTCADPRDSEQTAASTNTSTPVTPKAKATTATSIEPAALVRAYVAAIIRYYPAALREIEAVLETQLAEIRLKGSPTVPGSGSGAPAEAK
ncbi:MAG: ParB N-terminal domain-containing protein [Limisphaerales bacterium]